MVGIHTMWNEHFGIGVVEMMVMSCGRERVAVAPKFDLAMGPLVVSTGCWLHRGRTQLWRTKVRHCRSAQLPTHRLLGKHAGRVRLTCV